jgi:hypothetical protein
MKHDVWVFVLQPGGDDFSEFCFDAGWLFLDDQGLMGMKKF